MYYGSAPWSFDRPIKRAFTPIIESKVNKEWKEYIALASKQHEDEETLYSALDSKIDSLCLASEEESLELIKDIANELRSLSVEAQDFYRDSLAAVMSEEV